MTIKRRTLVALTAAMFTVSACSPSGRNPVQPEIDAQSGKDVPTQAQNTAQLSYDVERPVMAFAGMDAHLGGEQAANDALIGLMQVYKAKIVPAGDAVPHLIPASYEAHVADGMGALGAGYMMSALVLSAVASSDQSGSQSVSSNGVKMDVGVDGDKATVTSETDATFGKLSGKVRTLAKADLCPDPAGRVHINLTVDSSQTDGAGSGANTRVTVDVDRYFDDDAKVTSDMEYDGNVQQSAFEGGKGGYVDVSMKADMKSGSVKVNSRNAEATDAHVKAVQSYVTTTAALAYFMLGMAAEGRVNSGRCVDLKVSTDPEKRSHAQPATQYTITAMPRARADGAVAAGMVTATQSGDGKLSEPGQKKRADAQFHYTGPEKASQTGKVMLESRSKRGVGKETVDFDTWLNGWRTPPGAAYWPGGVICDVNKPFTFEGEGTTLTFTPRDASAGTFTLNSHYEFGNFKGSGTYTITVNPDGKTGTLSARGNMMMNVTGAGSRAAPLKADYPLESTGASANCS